MTTTHTHINHGINMTINGKAGNDVLWSGPGGDTLSGGDGEDILFGGKGNDNLTGGAGKDIFEFTAGSGNDIIYGNKGSDILYGGLGTDQLRGGLGLDTYVFPNSELEDGITDVIHELQKGEKIGLSSGIKWRKINATDDTAAPTTLTDSEVESYIQKIRN